MSPRSPDHSSESPSCPSRDAPGKGAKGTDRRTFIRRGIVAGGVLTAGGLGFADLLSSGHSQITQAQHRHESPTRAVAQRERGPNILVVLVDQLRAPQWFPPSSQIDALLSNVARLRSQSVSF
ncbi:MAG TPA: hypothetical protein VIJ33_00420, partial [Solirubrobacteraceae bacterium]